MGIPVSLLVIAGLGLAWWRFGGDSPAPTPKAPAIGQAEPTLQQEIMAESGTAPGTTIPEPQAEAAALKQKAVTVARQIAEAYPDHPLSYALLGSAYYNTGHSEAAIQHLRRCLEMDPNQGEAYGILARIAYERGELEEAIELGQQAVKLGQVNSEVLNQLGRALMDLGQTPEARDTLRQAAQLPRPTSESHYLLGQAHLQSGDPTEAKESFLRAIDLLPDHTQAFFGLYTACLRLGQTNEAARYREEFLKFEEVDRHTLTDRSVQQDTLTGLPLVRETVARTFFGAAQLHRLHERPDPAAELLRHAALLDVDNPMYRAALEAFYVQRNALADGVTAFQQLTANQPENHWNHFFLARLHDRRQQVDAAETAYRRVQQLAPDWPEGYRALADLYLRADVRLEDARALARRAVELEPSGPHYYLLALTCLKTNDRAAALAALEQAVELSPNEPRYRELRQEVRTRL